MTTTSRHFPLVRDMQPLRVDGEPVAAEWFFGPEYADWLYLGHFRHGEPFTEANFIALRATLRQVCGADSLHVGTLTDNDGSNVLVSVVIIRDLPEVMAIAGNLMDTHEAGEHISDEGYWHVVDVHMQRMWTNLSIPDRIDYVKRSGSSPGLVLEPYVSEDNHELWTMLYQDMGL